MSIIANKSEKSETPIRWFEPINMDTGYVFDLRFLEWKTQPISMISGIPNKYW